MPEDFIFDASDSAEVLRRQIHPSQFKVGSSEEIERTAFTPRWKNDEVEGEMSHLRGHVTAEDAYNRGKLAGLSSAGTWGVSVGETLSLDLIAGDDSQRPDRPQGHAFVRIESGRQNWKQLARALAAAASKRGCLYNPATASRTGCENETLDL